jgi:hypothetical protein
MSERGARRPFGVDPEIRPEKGLRRRHAFVDPDCLRLKSYGHECLGQVLSIAMTKDAGSALSCAQKAEWPLRSHQRSLNDVTLPTNFFRLSSREVEIDAVISLETPGNDGMLKW